MNKLKAGDRIFYVPYGVLTEATILYFSSCGKVAFLDNKRWAHVGSLTLIDDMVII